MAYANNNTDNELYRGTIIQFYNPISYIPGLEKFILAQCFETEFEFQIISIDKYSAGSVCGYIYKDTAIEGKSAITYQHLTSELKRNFGDFDVKTLRIINI